MLSGTLSRPIRWERRRREGIREEAREGEEVTREGYVPFVC